MSATMTQEVWKAKAVELFGNDPLTWRFVCPSCGHVAAVSAWLAAGAPENTVAFSCVGRWLPGTQDDRTFRKEGGPCTYAGGGLFRLNPVHVIDPDGKVHDVFAFDATATEAATVPVPPLAQKRRPSRFFGGEDVCAKGCPHFQSSHGPDGCLKCDCLWQSGR